MKPKVYVTRHLPDVAYKRLNDACHVEIWDRDEPPPYSVMLQEITDKEGLLCLLTDKIDASLMNAAPNLKVISQCAVGYDNIDISAAAKRGIVVGNTPEVLTDATADFAFALILAAARRVGEAIDYVREGKWRTWGLTMLLGSDVWGTTLGLVGLGRIGRAVAKRALGFEMRVLYNDTTRQPDIEAELGIEYRGFEDLLKESDFVSLHVNLNDSTQGLIGKQELALMKSSAILINTARGQVVESEALYQALKTEQIAYAALDVTDPEPLPTNHKLLELPNLIIVPHIASATITSRTRMALMAVDNLIAGVNRQPLPFPVQTVNV